jgi:tryptophan synthase beta chain
VPISSVFTRGRVRRIGKTDAKSFRTNRGILEFWRKYVPEALMAPLQELETVYLSIRKDPRFQSELRAYLKDYVGRPTPLYFAERLTEELGAKIY